MWYSIGDKYEIIKHNNANKPRRFRSNILMLLSLTALFLVHLSIFEIFIISISSPVFFYYLTMIVGITAMITSIVILILKYIKNNKEFDMLVMATFILSATVTYYAFFMRFDL